MVRIASRKGARVFPVISPHLRLRLRIALTPGAGQEVSSEPAERRAAPKAETVLVATPHLRRRPPCAGIREFCVRWRRATVVVMAPGEPSGAGPGRGAGARWRGPATTIEAWEEELVQDISEDSDE